MSKKLVASADFGTPTTAAIVDCIYWSFADAFGDPDSEFIRCESDAFRASQQR